MPRFVSSFSRRRPSEAFPPRRAHLPPPSLLHSRTLLLSTLELNTNSTPNQWITPTFVFLPLLLVSRVRSLQPKAYLVSGPSLSLLSSPRRTTTKDVHLLICLGLIRTSPKLPISYVPSSCFHRILASWAAFGSEPTVAEVVPMSPFDPPCFKPCRAFFRPVTRARSVTIIRNKSFNRFFFFFFSFLSIFSLSNLSDVEAELWFSLCTL